ncbi:hemerythrin [Streptomyces avidinii]|uniref:Uncharacterized protein n=1 Tax=Streptomyces avidinii TaxID=1895 RepID=A0ABS4L1D7_STRAV|nr:hypothetical protein [Streptomyces avidinii]
MTVRNRLTELGERLDAEKKNAPRDPVAAPSPSSK